MILSFYYHIVAAMSSAAVLESEATFQMQAQRAGLSQSYIDCIKGATLGTLGQLAYALDYTRDATDRTAGEQLSECYEAGCGPFSGRHHCNEAHCVRGADSHNSQLAKFNGGIG